MPSKLTGLFKTLAWTDFTGTPDSKKPTLDAFTSAAFNFSQQPNFGPVPGSPKLGQLIDNVVLDITLDSGNSWCRTTSIAAKGGTYSTDLLKHEQGHYDIVALTARDLFIDVMQIKGQTFTVLADALALLQKLLKSYDKRTDKISKLYDAVAETNHGNNATAQTKWNKMIERSFTEPRKPPMTAPDGKAYKIPFLDVLSQNSLTP